MPRITVIPQTVNPQTRLSAIEVVKRKVAGMHEYRQIWKNRSLPIRLKESIIQSTYRKILTGSLQECIRMRAFLLHLPGIEKDLIR